MKNFARLLMAITAMLAVSCAADATDELDVQLANECQTSITISLEGTKTHLGEKVGDEYPLFWSAGDKIAINGVASEALTEAAHGQSVANFVLNGVLAYPYNMVYPAPAEGVVAAEGKQAVTFLAEQNYKEGTFAEGAAPMYALVAEGEAISLKHLSGLICLAPMGEATLTSMTISAEKGKIAGNFDLNCADGTLVAHEDATNTITVSFGEGLVLGTEATPIYVALPAGEYGDLSITLHTAADSMTVRFNSDGEKAVKAGIVRKFADFAYSQNSDIPEVFEIYDEASLRSFAAVAATFFPRKSAKVTATIDMTGKQWIPIEGFGAYEFDGGKAEGFAIKGLSAPLFGTTSATITNVDLVDVNITESERIISGSLVCELSEGGSVSNCSVSGAYTYSRTTGTLEQGVISACVGGLVGKVVDADVNNCSSSVTFNLASICASNPAEKSYPAYGGLIGAIANANDSTRVYDNFVYSGEMSYDVATSMSKVQPIIGGVVGYCNATTISNSTNTGKMTYNGAVYCLYSGGVVGMSYRSNHLNLENNAPITIEGTVGYAYMGGVLGQVYDGIADHTAKNLTNRGKFTATENAFLSKVAAIGGIIGVAASNNLLTLSNSNNYGQIELISKDEASYLGSEARVGGIIGSSIIKLVDNCKNHAAISIKYPTATTQVGGLVGLMQSSSAATWQNCENLGAVSLSSTLNSDVVYVAGVAGNIAKGTVKSCTNSAPVTFSGSAASTVYIGGCVGYSATALTGIENKGAVTVTKDSKLVGLCLAGVVGWANTAVTKSKNSGVVTYLGTTDMSTTMNAAGDAVEVGNERFCVAGVIGWGATSNSELTNEEGGAINVAGTFTVPVKKKYGYLSVGGVAGTLKSGNHSKIYNYGAVTISSTIPNASWTEEPFVFAGALGYVSGNLTDVYNYGTVTYSGTSRSDQNIQVAGAFGRGSNDAADKYTNIVNNGKVVVSGKAIGASMIVSGIASYNTKSTYNNVVNNGDIEVSGAASKSLLVAGVLANPGNTVSTTGLVANTGTITVSGFGKTTVNVGGVMGEHNSANGSGYINTGDIFVERSSAAETDYPIYVGGIAATASVALENAKSYCLIKASDAKDTNCFKGWMTGSSRSETVIAKNCEIGGMLVDEYNVEDEEYQGTNINAKNYFNFIYGSADWTGVTDYDGCTHISKAPAIE